MVAPNFYNTVDQGIYNQGYSFIPQERFRGAFNPNNNIGFGSGITNTAAAAPFILPINQGGGGGDGSGGITDVADTSGFDYETDAYDLENKSAFDKGLTDEEQEALDAYGNPSIGMTGYGTIAGMLSGFVNPITGILGLVMNRKRKEQQAIEKAQTASAIADDARSTSAETHGGYGSGTGGVDATGPGSGGGYNEGNFCFDPNTLIQMFDGSEKKIKEIQLGDQTKGGEVTGVFQFKASDEIHNYKGVTVAGSHYVKEDGKFIMVKDSPVSVKIDKIPVVYSLDTSGRRIFIKDIEFADYNGDGVAKNFLTNAGVDLSGFDKEVLRQVENRLI
jgi:hypothetical protein|tara:strand:- start:50 stop:1048 length:999 start_codon:yes stop_codon:yes gene_type:complete